MKLTILLAVVLLGVLHQALSQRDTSQPGLKSGPGRRLHPSAGVACHTVRCHKNAPVCRVVKHWCGPGVSALCAPCVPPDGDAVCNSQYFMRAVLIKGWELEPLRCDVQSGLNKMKCPSGSVCVRDPKNPEFGVCCYDQVYFFRKPDKPLTNADRKCSTCDNCPPGTECKQYVSKCGRLRERCDKAKPKVCPPVNYGSGRNKIYCSWHSVMEDKCKADIDCPMGLKCCPGLCSGRRCQKGIDAPPPVILNSEIRILSDKMPRN